ncbi:hypothetical protein [Daejeonella sp. H1SJ63]|uniref:hypothetical protein n=1 Tax=Daejeonella sp. H1SJ63 TaxID=3034145 RepID=UPI0023EBCFA2|nr:hypothetical protein [Daejeonella sp. H1SJ63]
MITLWLILFISYAITSAVLIYYFFHYLDKRLGDRFSVWLFSITLSLGISFLLFLIAIILFVNHNFVPKILNSFAHV